MARAKKPINIFARSKPAPRQSIFSRAKAPVAATSKSKKARPKKASPFSFGLTAEQLRADKRWASSIPPPDDEDGDSDDDYRLADIFAQYARGGLEPHVIAVLRRIDPAHWYRLSLLVEDYETELPDDAPPGQQGNSRRRIVYVGIGRKLLIKVLYLMDACTILTATLHELSAEVQAIMEGEDVFIRPQWHTDKITLIDGTVKRGTGIKRAHKTRARSRRRSGRRTAEEQRLFDDRERQAKKRNRATQRRILDLEEIDPIAARELRRRSEGTRIGIKKSKTPKKTGGGIFARVVIPKKKQRRKKR